MGQSRVIAAPAPEAMPLRASTVRRGTRVSLDVAIPLALLLVVLVCLASPVFRPIPPPVGGNVLEANQPPSAAHVLGTDSNGNDVWSRLVHGGRTSLLIAVSVNLLGLFVGGMLGMTAAYLGGFADGVIMRSLDALIAFPPLILVLAIAHAFAPSFTSTISALVLFSVPAFARVARAATLRLREQPFVLVARLSGTGLWRILLRHIAPNIFPQLMSFALLGMAVVINIEGAVSFLGLGVPMPQPSWGNMIYQGQLTLSATPERVLLPSAFLFVAVLSFNLLSEALRVRWTK